MTERSSNSGVLGNCFVLSCRHEYIGCVIAQQEQFYSTACATYQGAVQEALRIAALLRDKQVITQCVCSCHVRSS